MRKPEDRTDPLEKHPFCIALFIAHFVAFRLFTHFNSFGTYYSATAAMKSTARQNDSKEREEILETTTDP